MGGLAVRNLYEEPLQGVTKSDDTKVEFSLTINEFIDVEYKLETRLEIQLFILESSN